MLLTFPSLERVGRRAPTSGVYLRREAVVTSTMSATSGVLVSYNEYGLREILPKTPKAALKPDIFIEFLKLG
jgi:hypothetical protein